MSKERYLSKIIRKPPLPDGIRKKIRELKAESEYDKADDIRKVTIARKELIINTPDQIKGRIHDYLNSVEKSLPKDLKEELREISPEEAKVRISQIEKISPEERNNDGFNLKKFITSYLKNVYSLPPGSYEREVEGHNFLIYVYLLNRVYHQDMVDLFTINGVGKTNWEKCREASLSRP